MIVDNKVHWLPQSLFTDETIFNSFIRTLPLAWGENVNVTTVPGTNYKQVIVSKPKGFENLNFNERDADTKDRLEAMDRAKVDKAILRMPCWQEWLTLELARKVNDEIAIEVKNHSDRFLGLGIVPPWGDKECLNELERCVNDLGLCGVEVAAHYGTLYLDHEKFKPYFKRLNELGIPVCIHHTPLPVEYNYIYEFSNLRRVYGRCVDQMTLLGRLLFSGFFDEFPNLKFIHTMLGGGFFAYADLLIPQKSKESGELERFDMVTDKIRGYLNRNVYFDVSHAPPWGKAQLECAVKVLGADHILFGSSYPLRIEWLPKGIEFVKNLDISEKEKALILGENAVRLFNIKA